MQTTEVMLIEVPGGHTFIEIVSGESRWEKNAIEGSQANAILLLEDTVPSHKMKET